MSELSAAPSQIDLANFMKDDIWIDGGDTRGYGRGDWWKRALN